MVESLIHEIFYCCCNKLLHSGYKIRIYYLTVTGGKMSDMGLIGLNQGLIRVMFLSEGSVGESISLLPLPSRNCDVHSSSCALLPFSKLTILHLFLTAAQKLFCFQQLMYFCWTYLEIQDNLPISMFITLTTSAKSLLPCKATYSWVMESRMWTSLSGVNILLIPGWYPRIMFHKCYYFLITIIIITILLTVVWSYT